MKGVTRHERGGNPLLAEAQGLLEGLRLAWHGGYRKIKCEVDCEELLAMLDNAEALAYFMEIADIKELLSRNWVVHLRSIPRTCNMAADCIAKFAARAPILGVQVLEEPFAELEIRILGNKLRVS